MTVVSPTSIARRRAIEYGLIRKATKPVPVYGTDDFLALEAGTAEFIASIVVAAGCWAADSIDNLEANLRCEIETMSAAAKAAEDEQYAERAAAHRRRYRHLAVVPSYGNQDTRVATARVPRPGDRRPDRGGDLDAG